LDPSGHVRRDGGRRLTYAGIGVYRAALLDNWPRHVDDDVGVTANGKPRFRLAPILRAHMDADGIHGEPHPGCWTDVGTPQRLAELEATLSV
jgi:MurNAc alpha-1-phosphate uridylyltransferase